MNAPEQTRPKAKCPTCGAPLVPRYRPFCSRRCADIDLNRWLTGHYSVPVVELDSDDIDALERGLDGDHDGDPEGDPEGDPGRDGEGGEPRH